MKHLTKYLFVVLLAICTAQAYSQYIVLKGGLNLSNQLIKDNNETYSTNFTNKPGFHAGLMAGIGFGPMAVEGGLLASSKGYQYSYTEVNGTSSTKYIGSTNLVYLDVPINLKLSAGLGGIRVFGTVGPVFSFGLTGKSDDEYATNGGDPVTSKEPIKWGSTADDDYKPMDVGLGLGAGIVVGKLILGVTYNIGLSNLAPITDNGAEIKNKVLQFSIGFKIFGR
jgi:hypothetical protein